MNKRLGALFTGALLLGVAIAGDSTSAPIKALSAQEQADLLDGKGMGLAKAAELNGYPGPRHVLELAEPLQLSADQQRKTQALFDRMREDARRQGAALIEAERALDNLYATHTATAALVEQRLVAIEAARSRLRAVHLTAHLEQSALLSDSQIAKYSELRGYVAGEQGLHKGH